MERGIQVVNVKIPKILLMTLWVFLPSVLSYVTELTLMKGCVNCRL